MKMSWRLVFGLLSVAGCDCGDGGDEADADSDTDTDTDSDADTDADTDSDLDDSAICTDGGWCWETPLPAGGAITDLWVTGPGALVAASGTHLFHVEGDVVRHATPPTLTPFLNRTPIWGISADDVWSAGFGSLIHFDGVRWSLEESPLVRYADSISGFAHGDVWATGFSSLFHYDGAAWSAVDAATNETTTFTDVWAIGPEDAIVVGWDGTFGFARRVQGDVVTDLSLPTTGAVAYPSAVYASSPDEVWVVQGGAAWHRSGGEWTERSLGGYSVMDAWGSGAGDAWFVGGASLYHWDGSEMETIAVDGSFQLTAVSGSSPTDVWVSDTWGALRHWDGAEWTALKAPISADDFVGVAADASGEAWAIGNRGGVAHRDASGAWTSEESPTESTLVGVAATSAETFLFAAGGSYRRDGAEWQLVLGGSGLVDACATDDGTTRAVGTTFARYEGGEWVPDDFTPARAGDHVFCVGSDAWATSDADLFDGLGGLYRDAGEGWGHVGLASVGGLSVRSAFSSAPDDGWVVAADPESGANAIVMRFDGAEWAELPVDGDVHGVGGAGPDDVILVGESGFVRVWDGETLSAADAPGGPDFAWVQGRGGGAARAVARSGAVWDYVPGADPEWREIVPSLAGGGLSSDALSDAAFAGDEIYGAGDSDEALRVVSGAWQALPGWFSAVRVDANETSGAWFVDFIGRVGHFDGAEVVQPDGDVFSADDVVVPRVGDEVFVIERGTVMRLSGSDFVVEHATDADEGTLFASSDDALWFFDRVDFGDERTEVWRKSGGEWKAFVEMATPIGISAGPDGRLLAVDADLRTWRREDGAWRALSEAREGWEHRGTSAHVLDVDDAWVLALGGLMHWDGAAWSQLADPVGLGFMALEPAPDGGTFAVGTGASVVHRAP